MPTPDPRPPARARGLDERRVAPVQPERGAEEDEHLEAVLRDGIGRLTDIERALPSEPEHFVELRRRLSESCHALPRGPKAAPIARRPRAAPLQRPLQLVTDEAPVAVDGVAQIGSDVGSDIGASGLPSELVGVARRAWPTALDAWREQHAALIAARRALSEEGRTDAETVDALRGAVAEELARAAQLDDGNPWRPPGRDEDEVRRLASGNDDVGRALGRRDELDREGIDDRGRVYWPCEWSWGKQAVWTMTEHGPEQAGLSAYYFTPRKPPPAGCPPSP